jgi:hypothetical protein
MTGYWRKMLNEELHDLYCSLYVIGVIKWRRMRWVWHVAHMGLRYVHPVFWRGNLQEMVGRCGLEDNIKMHLKETGWQAVNWSSLAQGGEIC